MTDGSAGADGCADRPAYRRGCRSARYGRNLAVGGSARASDTSAASRRSAENVVASASTTRQIGCSVAVAGGLGFGLLLGFGSAVRARSPLSTELGLGGPGMDLGTHRRDSTSRPHRVLASTSRVDVSALRRSPGSRRSSNACGTLRTSASRSTGSERTGSSTRWPAAPASRTWSSRRRRSPSGALAQAAATHDLERRQRRMLLTPAAPPHDRADQQPDTDERRVPPPRGR